MKTALITGASRGIGLETCKALAGSGGSFERIVMVGRKSEHFDNSVSEVRAINADCDIIAIVGDLSDLSAIDGIYAELENLNINVNLIVNNAGFTKPEEISDATVEDFHLTMTVNLYAPFKMIKAALEKNHPLKQIVNIASTAGINGRGGWLTYSASKAALINMSDALREELQPQGIEVICLSPGRTATDLRRTLAPDEDPTTIMQPEQVGKVINMMTSEIGQMLHSQNIVVRT
jgi:3-oxoacyl-[acyl-carrier protein] reductase